MNAGTPVTSASLKPRVSQVEDALNAAGSIITNVEEVIANLYSKLACVLRDTPPTLTEDKEEPYQVELALAVRRLNRRLIAIDRQLHDIYERIEL